MKNFINIRDISSFSLRNILSDAKKRKIRRKKLNVLEKDKDVPLKGKLLVQMFEKSSLRTRLSFYIAIKQLGGNALTLRPNELHLNSGEESISDTIKIIGTYADAFMLRTDSDKKIKEIIKYSNVPVINGLSPSSHPTQILSDIFTIEEVKKKNISKLNICWVGDCNNVSNSLIEASIKFDFPLSIGCPKKYLPSKYSLERIKKKNKKIHFFHEAAKAVNNADVIFTDKVISMNDKGNKAKKLKEFKNFRITSSLLLRAKKDAIFLHCLPRGNEVSDGVFNSNSSKVWLQALNRVHVQKSILLYCFEKLR